jgi:16S rRNA (guanine527-N7)-methyltransferase
MAKQKDDALRDFNVSRETLGRLDTIVQALQIWQPRINLISGTTLPDVWERHVADGLQLVPLVNSSQGCLWVDLGSGGGFPGLVVAAVLADDPLARVVLIESNGKKCAFLREAARLARLPVEVRNKRIEDGLGGLENADVVSARALAPLATLIDYTQDLLKTGTVGVFPKGAEVERELTDARKSWSFDVDRVPSKTDPDGTIVILRNVTALQGSGSARSIRKGPR